MTILSPVFLHRYVFPIMLHIFLLERPRLTYLFLFEPNRFPLSLQGYIFQNERNNNLLYFLFNPFLNYTAVAASSPSWSAMMKEYRLSRSWLNRFNDCSNNMKEMWIGGEVSSIFEIIDVQYQGLFLGFVQSQSDYPTRMPAQRECVVFLSKKKSLREKRESM